MCRIGFQVGVICLAVFIGGSNLLAQENRGDSGGDAALVQKLATLLVKQLDDPSPEVRNSAARGITQIAGRRIEALEKVLPRLIELLGDPSHRENSSAIETAIRTFGERGMAEVIKELEKEDPEQVANALQALALFQEDGAAHIGRVRLILAETENRRTRAAAIHCLARIGINLLDTIYPAIEPHLNDGDEAVQLAIHSFVDSFLHSTRVGATKAILVSCKTKDLTEERKNKLIDATLQSFRSNHELLKTIVDNNPGFTDKHLSRILSKAFSPVIHAQSNMSQVAFGEEDQVLREHYRTLRYLCEREPRLLIYLVQHPRQLAPVGHRYLANLYEEQVNSENERVRIATTLLLSQTIQGLASK